MQSEHGAGKRARAAEASGSSHVEVADVCWMCMYQSDDEAKRLMEFIVRSVGYIDTVNISSQVSAFIYTRYHNAADAGGAAVPVRGARPEDIERHICKHILHPRVRIAVIIKDLLEFLDHLHKNLVVEDVSTGMTAVDKGIDCYSVSSAI